MTRSAHEIADAVRAGRLRATDVLEECVERIAKYNDELLAFVFLDLDRARRVAADVDARVAAGDDPGSLAGVPLGIKCTESVEGWPETRGSLAFADEIARWTGTQPARLLAAGAVPVGLTAAPPFGLLAHTASSLYGVTRNPWRLSQTPGGSSGGTSAALSAGLVPLATGGDTGGSIRNPASFTGVVGFKPTIGRIPRGPGFLGAGDLYHLGPLARTVRDAARYVDVAAGPSEFDPRSSVAPPSVELSLDRDLSGIRVAYMDTLGLAPSDPGVGRVTRDAASALVAGAGLHEVAATADLPKEDDLGISAAAALLSEVPADEGMQAKLPDVFADIMATPGGQDVIEALAGSVSPTPERVKEARQFREQINAGMAVFFEQADALLIPTMAFTAFGAEGPMPREIAGQTFGIGCVAAFTTPFNISGHPAVSVPAGLLDGMPVGLQIVCRRHDDGLALALAAALERIQPWPLVAPAYAG